MGKAATVWGRLSPALSIRMLPASLLLLLLCPVGEAAARNTSYAGSRQQPMTPANRSSVLDLVSSCSIVRYGLEN